MSRRHRVVLAGQPMHITQRGNNRTAMFRAPDDYHRLARVLQIVNERVGCAIHAWVFMTNHIHLLLTPPDARAPARLMQRVGRRYVRYFNVRYSRTGTLWEGRYRSTLVGSERHFLACSRYIELNPVRAGMVAHPGQHEWSSYRRNADGERDPLLTSHALYDALGTTPADRCAAYRALFEHHLEVAAAEGARRTWLAGADADGAPRADDAPRVPIGQWTPSGGWEDRGF